MAKKPPIPIDPRDRIIDELINDKNRLYIETRKLQQQISALKAQKKMLRSRLKHLQRRYDDSSNEEYSKADYKKRSGESN